MSSKTIDTEKVQRHDNIRRAANMKYYNTPQLDQLIYYRNLTAKKLLDAKSDPEVELLNAQYDHCNKQIKLLLAL